MAKSIHDFWKHENISHYHTIHGQKKIWCNLIFVNFRLLKLGLTLLLKCDDDQGHENIDEKEREDNEVNNVEYGHLYSIHWNGTLIFISNSHGLLQDSANN